MADRVARSEQVDEASGRLRLEAFLPREHRHTGSARRLRRAGRHLGTALRPALLAARPGAAGRRHPGSGPVHSGERVANHRKCPRQALHRLPSRVEPSAVERPGRSPHPARQSGPLVGAARPGDRGCGQPALEPVGGIRSSGAGNRRSRLAASAAIRCARRTAISSRRAAPCPDQPDARPGSLGGTRVAPPVPDRAHAVRSARRRQRGAGTRCRWTSAGNSPCRPADSSYVFRRAVRSVACGRILVGQVARRAGSPR